MAPSRPTRNEFQDILGYFQGLYRGPVPSEDHLCETISFTQDEVIRALQRLAPGKAMPVHSAPAAVWKTLQETLAPLVTQQLRLTFGPGPLTIPRAWCVSELVLVPKPGKALTSVSQLRPICLLSPMAKILASTLAEKDRSVRGSISGPHPPVRLHSASLSRSGSGACLWTMRSSSGGSWRHTAERPMPGQVAQRE